MAKNPQVSVVIPVFNEESNIPLLYPKLRDVLNSLDKPYEIVFVDDGSTDNTPLILKGLNPDDKNLRIISLKRNFGKSVAYSIGFMSAKGDVVITMDGDLQDDPQDIPMLLDKINADGGYDIVSGWKKNKHEGNFFYSLSSRIFNKLTSVITGLNLHDFNCPFKAYRGEIVKDLRLYGGMYRYIPAIAHWNGYKKITEIPVKNLPRRYGKSKYSVLKVYKGFLDMLTFKFLNDFLEAPLYLFGTLGLIAFFAGSAISAHLAYVHFIFGERIGDRPLLILGVLLLLLGVNFISLGLLGEMLVKKIPTDLKDKIIE